MTRHFQCETSAEFLRTPGLLLKTKAPISEPVENQGLGHFHHLGSMEDAVGAPQMINQAFSHLKYTDENFFRADSAFCNQECGEEAVRQGAKFSITAHGNTLWEQKIDNVANWAPWQWSEQDLSTFIEKKQQPPQI
jgi:hypothetical protein